MMDLVIVMRFGQRLASEHGAFPALMNDAFIMFMC